MKERVQDTVSSSGILLWPVLVFRSLVAATVDFMMCALTMLLVDHFGPIRDTIT